MPEVADHTSWEHKIDDLPKPVKAGLIFLRLSVWQMLIAVLVLLVVFYIAKDMGWLPDERTKQIDAVIRYLEGNSVMLQQVVKSNEQIIKSNEQHAQSTEQIARYLCWQSPLSSLDKRIACTK